MLLEDIALFINSVDRNLAEKLLTANTNLLLACLKFIQRIIKNSCLCKITYNEAARSVLLSNETMQEKSDVVSVVFFRRETVVTASLTQRVLCRFVTLVDLRFNKLRYCICVKKKEIKDINLFLYGFT